MQAVFLAAGESTRTEPLTLTRPKPLLTAANKTIIEHNLEQLEQLAEIEEVVIVIGYKGGMIKEKLGDTFGRLPLKYVEQTERKGSGHALQAARELLQEKFLLLNGDDFYSAKDIKQCLGFDYCIMGKEQEKAAQGVIEVKKDKVISFEEQPEQPKSNIQNTGCYVFQKKVLDFELTASPRGELEVTDFISFLVERGEDVHCVLVKDYWFPVKYAWDILTVNEFFVRNLNEDRVEGEIEENVVVKGKLVLGKGSKILSGSYIDGNAIIGENAVLGPNVIVRGHRGGVTIGNKCKISNTDIINSVIMDNTKAKHFNYIGDSVIGENCNFGAGTIIANWRHDNQNIKSEVKGERIDTGRRKFGTIMGDNCKTGVQTSIYPGRKMWPGTLTLPGEIVTKDKKE